MRGIALVAIALIALIGCSTAGEKPVMKQCTADSMCPMATPHCDDNFQCTGCVVDNDCAPYAATPHCLSGGGGCVACVDSTQCANPTPVCDVSHACRACTADNECVSQVCDVDSGACVSPEMVLYATANGTDTASCLQGSPCSLAHALALVYPLRPYVRMLPGFYHSALAIAGTAPMPTPVTIVATGATLTGDSSQPNYGVYVDNSNAVTIRGLVVQLATPSPNGDIWCHGPLGGTPTKLTLRDVTLAGSLETQYCQLAVQHSNLRGASVEFFNGSITDIERSMLGTVVVYSSDVLSLAIVNSLLTTVDLHLLTQPCNATVFLAYDTFYGMPEDCSSANLPSGVTFVNDIFVAPMAKDSIVGTHCTLDTNIAFPQTTTLGINTIVMDPKLANAAGGDFHLTASSPAIDAARPTTMDPAVDYAGTPRPQGGARDIGAYEYKAP